MARFVAGKMKAIDVGGADVHARHAATGKWGQERRGTRNVTGTSVIIVAMALAQARPVQRVALLNQASAMRPRHGPDRAYDATVQMDGKTDPGP